MTKKSTPSTGDMVLDVLETSDEASKGLTYAKLRNEIASKYNVDTSGDAGKDLYGEIKAWCEGDGAEELYVSPHRKHKPARVRLVKYAPVKGGSKSAEASEASESETEETPKAKKGSRK